MLFMRLEDGKVAEIWGIFDTYREHRQLGSI
jgi:predicted ester cyclase